MNQQQKYFKPYKRMASPFFHMRRTPQSPQLSPKGQKDRNRMHTQYTHKEFHVPIWQHLYQHGIKKQIQRQQNKQKSHNKIDVQCTFQPAIKKNARYLLTSNSNFLQRNQLWMQNKIEKIIKEKEHQITSNLKDCTFKPRINEKSKKMPKEGRKNAQHDFCNRHKSNCKGHDRSARNISNSKKIEKNDNENLPIKSSNKKTTENVMEIGQIRSIIRNQLKRIQL